MENKMAKISFVKAVDKVNVTDLNLVIFIGLTGVGKTTTFQELSTGNVNFRMLPDRRRLTDEVMIPEVLRLQNLEIQPVTDRVKRFELTKIYREKISNAGMAEVLSKIWVESSDTSMLFFFDGLRGENELEFAISQFPRAHFVLLDAPDSIRIQRLIQRKSSFDSISQSMKVDLGMNIADSFFTKEESESLLDLVRTGSVSADELVKKTKIVLKEAESYKPKETKAVLLHKAKNRSLIVDTSKNKSDKVAWIITQYLKKIRW